jgi:hypothetical protein
MDSGGGDNEQREARRRRLTGRAMVIGFALLVLVYVLATFIR